MNISDILQKFRMMSPNTREQGKLFEKFTRMFLLESPQYSKTVRNVWLWSDFPCRGTTNDIGIDLVAETVEGEFWAVQCKFFQEGAKVQKGDIDAVFVDSFERAAPRQGSEGGY